MKSDRSLNPYSILGVTEEASQKKITSAYRRLARKFHPDVNHSPQATERMKEINWAYELLGSPWARVRYDRQAHPQEPVEASGSRAPSPKPGGETADQIWRDLESFWPRILDPEVEIMQNNGIAAIVGSIFVIAIFSITSYLSNPEHGFLTSPENSYVGIPLTLTLWLIAVFPLMNPDGRGRGLVATAIGLLASTLVYLSYTLLVAASEVGSDSLLATGQNILLAGIPISAICGSFVGLMDDEG